MVEDTPGPVIPTHLLTPLSLTIAETGSYYVRFLRELSSISFLVMSFPSRKYFTVTVSPGL
jgi:hypothetical protein